MKQDLIDNNHVHRNNQTLNLKKTFNQSKKYANLAQCLLLRNRKNLQKELLQGQALLNKHNSKMKVKSQILSQKQTKNMRLRALSLIKDQKRKIDLSVKRLLKGNEVCAFQKIILARIVDRILKMNQLKKTW